MFQGDAPATTGLAGDLKHELLEVDTIHTKVLTVCTSIPFLPILATLELTHTYEPINCVLIHAPTSDQTDHNHLQLSDIMIM